MSHSSVLKGGVIEAARARDFWAHERAFEIKEVWEGGGMPGVGGGDCWAREVARLFTVVG